MPSLPKDAWTLAGVHLATAACCLAAGWFTHTQGTDLPVRDEWPILAEWCRSRSTAEWAFAHYSEHRFPVANLVWIGLLRATGFNLKVPMYGTVGLFTAAAVLLQWTARRVRGRAHAVDAAFPVLLLHWGAGLNFVFGYQIGYGLLVYGLAGWVWCAGRLATGGGNRWGGLSVPFTALVTTTGPFGLAFTPAVVGWFAYLAVRAWRQRSWGWLAAFAAVGVATGAYSVWVYSTMPPLLNPGISPTAEPGRFGQCVLDYLRLGSGAGIGWNDLKDVVRGAVLVLYAVGLAAAAVRVWRGEQRAVWVVAGMVMLASVLVGVAVARGRGSSQEWYTSVSAVGLAAAVLAVSRHPLEVRPRWGQVVSAALILAAVGGLYRLNMEHGRRTGFLVRTSLAELRHDIDAGYPPSVVIGRNGGNFAIMFGEHVAAYFDILRDAGLPHFRAAGREVPAVAVPVAGLTTPFTLSSDPGRTADGCRTQVTLPDPPPGAVVVRVRTTTVESAGRHRVAVEWTDADTGQAYTDAATPAWTSGFTVNLVYPLHGRPTGVRLVTHGTIFLLRVEAVEWLLPASP